MVTELVTLDKLGTVSRGRSKHRPRNDARLYGGSYPFIQTSDIKHAGLYLNDYEQTYNELGLSQSKLWPVNTLCITIAANIADTTILGIPACFPDSVMGFIPFEGIADVRYVKYMFDVLQNQCKQISQGTAQDNMSWERLSTIKFAVPNYETQVKIADTLAAYDSLIENNRKQIKLLEEAAQCLYKEWFIDLRFPGHESTPINPETGLPEGWEPGSPIGTLIKKLESGKRPKGGIDKNLASGTPSIGAENVLGVGRYNFASEKLIPNDYFESMRKGIVHDRDILVYKDGAYTGRVSIAQDGFPYSKCAVNEHVFLVATEKESDQYWLYFTLERKDIFNAIQKVAISSAQPGINQDDFKSIRTAIPTEDLREKYSQNVSKLVSRIILLAKQSRAAEAARDRLLPKLMSGEIEV